LKSNYYRKNSFFRNI